MDLMAKALSVTLPVALKPEWLETMVVAEAKAELQLERCLWTSAFLELSLLDLSQFSTHLWARL